MSASVISGIVESTSLFCYTVGMHWLLGSRKTESVWTCWIARRSIYVQRLCVLVSLIIWLWVDRLQSGIIGSGASVFKVKDMWIDRWKLKNIEKSCYLRLRHIDVTSCDSAGETVHANSWIVRLHQPIFASIVKPIPAYEAVQDCGTIHQVHLCSTWIVLTLTASSIETQKIPYVHIHSWFMTLCQASETQLLTKAS